MLRKILIGLGILVLLLLIGFGVVYYLVRPDENRILGFIQENPDKAAILLVRNDSILAAKNTERQSPLASTVKILLAIEYAEQAAAGLLAPDSLIALSELEQFHVENTDGGAHPVWLSSVEDKIEDGKISLREIAKGMIKYSSNANTEWLSALLGLEKINARIDSLGLQNHTPFYYIVSALFVGKEAFPHLEGEELVNKLKALSQEEYISFTDTIHQRLLQDPEYKKEVGDLSMAVQRVWSDNLPASTVSDYVSILKKINSRTYFSAEAQAYLDEVMEFLMENPANQSWLKHSGMKGGSTAFVLTQALYARDKTDNLTELACFFNDISIFQLVQLQASMNEFGLKILSDKAFREQVTEVLQ